MEGVIRLEQYVMPYDPLIQRMARELTLEQAYYYIRDNIAYHTTRKDYWKSARQTLLDGWGDCFDKSILLQSYIMAKGLKGHVKFVFLPKEFNGHAYNVVFYNGEMISLDTTCPECDFGVKPDVKEVEVATFDGYNLYVKNNKL